MDFIPTMWTSVLTLNCLGVFEIWCGVQGSDKQLLDFRSSIMFISWQTIVIPPLCENHCLWDCLLSCWWLSAFYEGNLASSENAGQWFTFFFPPVEMKSDGVRPWYNISDPQAVWTSQCSIPTGGRKKTKSCLQSVLLWSCLERRNFQEHQEQKLCCLCVMCWKSDESCSWGHQ